jgi:hypothetical protein
MAYFDQCHVVDIERIERTFFGEKWNSKVDITFVGRLEP